mmetsp:Transcript_5709/g.9560  ORF Transcript_5709/g.9560 Transcript_5709/m.9560 type:complete len:88 (-) Transcript_5709:243-506(-)|eukprot:CAMPEP_0197024050 /NCGR_PEP_ID=MMETSP1384-20130603/4703_1 /TAXON_ID=29189 /ORGANISM="Ammonia sp." /LENGTH=87 /DNA_ID=CAMNT_0042452379 /DNA_START=114 /DNA_END=377 /DNA_ORIENTATION=+
MANIAIKHLVFLCLTLLFLFLGILGTCCQNGVCGGDSTGWEYVGYFGWGLGLVSTCGGIISSQGGSASTDLNKLEEEKAAALDYTKA